jgi:radical SAM protein with 4Fe4S-binding SPASM domain
MTNEESSMRNHTTSFALASAVNLKRRLTYHLTTQPLPFPTLFQIQTNNLCNGSCIMCPISREKNTTPGEMTDEVFEKIIKEIAKNATKDTFIWLHLQNEPLTDPLIFQKIQHINKVSNRTIRTGLVTNGTLLTEEIIKELNTSGLGRICFSIDAFTEKTYHSIRKGLNYDTLLQNIEHLQKSQSNVKIFVRFIWQKENYHELNDFKKYWKQKGIATEIGVVNNRAGAVSNFNAIRLQQRNIPFQYRLVQNMWLLFTKGCYNLANSFNILYNGDVIMCCNDYHKKTILGNVLNTSIQEIWTNKKYQSLRETIFKKDFGNNPECQSCSVIRYSWME